MSPERESTGRTCEIDAYTHRNKPGTVKKLRYFLHHCASFSVLAKHIEKVLFFSIPMPELGPETLIEVQLPCQCHH